MDQRATELERKKAMKNETNATTFHTIPYIKGLSKVLSSVFCSHTVVTTMRPQQTLKRMLVHHKNKRTLQEIHYKECLNVYTS